MGETCRIDKLVEDDFSESSYAGELLALVVLAQAMSARIELLENVSQLPEVPPMTLRTKYAKNGTRMWQHRASLGSTMITCTLNPSSLWGLLSSYIVQSVLFILTLFKKSPRWRVSFRMWMLTHKGYDSGMVAVEKQIVLMRSLPISSRGIYGFFWASELDTCVLYT